MRTHTLMLTLMLALTCAAPANAADSTDDPDPQGRYARYRMVLTQAGEQGGPLVVNLHARDGKVSTGWASVGYEAGFIRTHELQRDGGLLRGRLAVDVGPLQYVCDLDARVVGDDLAGTYAARRGIVGAVDRITGAASGRLSPCAEGGDLQVELHLWSMYTEFGHIRNPNVQATVRGGRITAGTFEFGRNPANRGKLEGGNLHVRDGRLTGSIHATVLAGDASPGTFTFAANAPVRSNFLQGTYDTTKDKNNWGTHGLTGEVRGLGDPGDGGVLVLALDGGIEGNRPLTLYRNEFTNGYEVNMEHPVVAGFLLERNEEGRVVCYDLRKDSP